jgi:hypothetical protein
VVEQYDVSGPMRLQEQPLVQDSPRQQFWEVIRRYPLLRDALREDRMLEFRMYKNVQHMTDTFLSPRRYGMVGDAASVIDAYYSQGMSLALLTSWHIANIVEGDLRQGRLDGDYLRGVNRCTRQDWHMLRNMLAEKYTEAILDSRFILPPELVQRLQRALQRGLGERARFRLRNGIELPPMKFVRRPDSPYEPIARLLRLFAKLYALDWIETVACKVRLRLGLPITAEGRRRPPSAGNEQRAFTSLRR